MKKKSNNQLTLNLTSNNNNQKVLVKEEIVTSSNVISISDKLIEAKKAFNTKLNAIVISRSDHLS